jgi:hypothetical protein
VRRPLTPLRRSTGMALVLANPEPGQEINEAARPFLEQAEGVGAVIQAGAHECLRPAIIHRSSQCTRVTLSRSAHAAGERCAGPLLFFLRPYKDPTTVSESGRR